VHGNSADVIAADLASANRFDAISWILCIIEEELPHIR